MGWGLGGLVGTQIQLGMVVDLLQAQVRSVLGWHRQVL